MTHPLEEIPTAISEYSNESRQIFIGPVLVFCVCIAGDGAQADCQVYDGSSTNGKLKVHLEALSGTTFQWNPGVGVHFDNGIYLAVKANTTKVTVTFMPLRKKERP